MHRAASAASRSHRVARQVGAVSVGAARGMRNMGGGIGGKNMGGDMGGGMDFDANMCGGMDPNIVRSSTRMRVRPWWLLAIALFGTHANAGAADMWLRRVTAFALVRTCAVVAACHCFIWNRCECGCG